MSAESQHTPGPWDCWQSQMDQGTNYWRVRTAPPESGFLDTLSGYCGEANARFIVRACNAHSELESLCMDLLKAYNCAPAGELVQQLGNCAIKAASIMAKLNQKQP